MKKRRKIILIVLGIILVLCAAILLFALPKSERYFEIQKSNVSAVEYENAPNLHQKVITFETEWDGTGTVVISEGAGGPYMSGIVKVTEKEISVGHQSEEPVTDLSEEHGLTISGHFEVESNHRADRTATIKLKTDGGEYTAEVPYEGHGELIRAEIDEGVFRKARLKVECAEYQAKTWAFGDSYFDKWVPYAVQNGTPEVLWDGYSGRKSEQALESLYEDLKYGKPEKLLWCMGMNDPDEGDKVNADWLKVYDEVRQICREKGIEFIPATIPNVPERDHRAKNRIIRESGYRYIDISKAVGADEKAEWNEGLLWPDRTHPSEEGSRVIAETVLEALKKPGH